MKAQASFAAMLFAAPIPGTAVAQPPAQTPGQLPGATAELAGVNGITIRPGIAASRAERSSYEIRHLTDANGNYIFRDLAPGTYHISVGVHGKEFGRTVTLDPDPLMIAGLDIEVEPNPTPAAPRLRRAASLSEPQGQ